MPNKQNNSAKFTFFYLISLISLIFVAIAAGNIIFQIINKYVIDIIHNYSGTYSADSLKFALSSLIIATPIYFLSTKQINKNLLTKELSHDNGIRKWLTYLILLVSSIVAIGWLIAILYSLLDGDLTLKFSLKTLTALSISAIIASYYYFDIKREKIEDKQSKTIKYYFYGTLTLIILTIFAGLLFVESPKETRQRKIDNLILEKFNRIRINIDNFYADNQKLPQSLQELTNDIEYLTEKDIKYIENTDVIEYKILEDQKYALCATFYLSNLEINSGNYNYLKKDWPHKSGYKCFSKKIKEVVNIPMLREIGEKEIYLPPAN